MKPIPTAEEFMYLGDVLNPNRQIINLMKEFAKLHVKAALEAAALEVDNEIEKDFISRDTIITAYPLTNIK